MATHKWVEVPKGPNKFDPEKPGGPSTLRAIHDEHQRLSDMHYKAQNAEYAKGNIKGAKAHNEAVSAHNNATLAAVKDSKHLPAIAATANKFTASAAKVSLTDMGKAAAKHIADHHGTNNWAKWDAEHGGKKK